MTIQAQIDALVAKADPLRELNEDDPRKAPLAGIVDEINRLRTIQSNQALAPLPASVEGADQSQGAANGKEAATHADEAPDEAGQKEEVLKRRPGRPRKADK